VCCLVLCCVCVCWLHVVCVLCHQAALLRAQPKPNRKPTESPQIQVAALQTEAVLDVMTDEWVVHTPEEGAIKW
jgi:hypothetical protein